MSRRQAGFTLIELLVVIAIIAILAAMLFPVFARARESARKIQCLSNVKNIAIAVQIYLSDFDRFPPTDHSAVAQAYFNTIKEDCSSGTITSANPYLRWPVIFDEYVKNRDVWRCPSAKIGKGAATIVWPVPSWIDYYKRWEGSWSRPASCSELGGGPCGVAFPAGWGGSITDSHAQVACTNSDTGGFEQSVGTSGLEDMKTSQIDDPSWFVVCGDTGGQVQIFSPSMLAFPDVCALNGCGTCCYTEPAQIGCCAQDWDNCPVSGNNPCIGVDLKLKFWTDANTRKSQTRHLGGSNIGFADGHANWAAADAIIANAPSSNDPNNGSIRGIGCACLPPLL